MRGKEVFYKQTDERLRVLEDNLAKREARCRINLLGVLHEGLPKSDIADQLHKSDSVTLELTRRTVEACLV